MKERTLSILKPDVSSDPVTLVHMLGELTSVGFSIVTLKRHTFTRDQVKEFYAEHVGKSYYQVHEDFMTSGPVIVLVLEKENAITDLRKMMGFYDPKLAEEGTLRNKYGKNSPQNAIHGSDSPSSAQREIEFFS